MAKQPRNRATGLIETPSTACLVDLKNMRFQDADNFVMEYDMQFNGLADNYTDSITFPRNSSEAAKSAQVRQRVNAILADREPGASNINNANIQIRGMPR